MRLSRCTTLFSALSAGAIVGIMLLICLNVLLRPFGLSVPGLVEIVEVLMPASAFLAAAGCQRGGHHVSMDLVVTKLDASTRRIVVAIANLVSIGFLMWLTFATTLGAWHSWQLGETRFGVLQIPIWPTRILIAMGSLLWTLEVIRSLRRLLAAEPEFDETEPAFELGVDSAV